MSGSAASLEDGKKEEEMMLLKQERMKVEYNLLIYHIYLNKII